jgi:rhamnose utilization protein RhaD (predicted bifunctional aldolase and dehydrogenase)
MDNFLATLHQLLQKMKKRRTEKIWKTKPRGMLIRGEGIFTSRNA